MITVRKRKEVHKMKMRIWDNDFDRMFDEALEELEKNQENNEKNA
jgi:hypothetical protein